MFAQVIEGKNLDRFGILLSIGCAIHCVVMGLLPLFLNQATSGCCHDCEGWSFHQIAIGVVMVVTLVLLARCFRQGGWLNFGLLLTGLGLLWAPQLSWSLMAYETMLTVSGATLIAWAHFRNLEHHKSCCAK